MFDNLFQFIMQNLFFFLLVIGGIISFFQRLGGEEEKKKQQRQQGRPQRQQRPQGQQRQPGREPKIDWDEIFRQEKNNPNQSRPTQQNRPISRTEETIAPIDERRNELYERIEAAKREKEKANERLERAVDSPIFKNDITKSGSKLDLNFKKVSAEQAMKGVIWAEILNKPKARRTYSNQNQYGKRMRG
ncbi:hypothetical protein ACJ2A9_05700 [Anaerobacillus sp. MEB173]|uniref:hypothetical protein n=1 Tax=Anaerobacillus sp. MEB173 TaxID=3383345 RepID=UPI003F90BD01